MRRSATPPRRRGYRRAMLAALLALAACTQVKETLETADAKLHEMAGSEPAGATASSPADADVEQAVRYMDGDGVARDPQRAVALLRPHAEAGHAEAQFLLGLAYAGGNGVAKDPATAVSWYRRAAAQDQPHAQYLLGLALLRGKGTPKDDAAASEWFAKAARAGHAGAQYHLGIAYGQDQGVPQDLAQSTRWFEAAAEQGHAEAQYMTGAAYEIGRGVAKHRAWATRWFSRAARQGVADAQYMTGLAYAAGVGLPQDLESAYRWLSLAAAGGVEKAAPFRERIGGRLSDERRARAQAAAGSWRPVDAAATTGADDAASVMFAQYTLSRLGYDPGPLDGRFGPRTSSAVRAYQAARGESADGTLTSALLNRLKNEPLDAG